MDEIVVHRISSKEQLNRKRKKSFPTGNQHSGVDASYVPNKKHRHFRRQPSVLPSKFLLGGNINDPLNLNSLGNSDNAETPKSSPVPIPPHRVGEIPVFIPRNVEDPLSLRSEKDVERLQDLISGVRANHNKHRKSRHRRRSLRKRNDSECSVETTTTHTETEIEELLDESENELESCGIEGEEEGNSPFDQVAQEVTERSNTLPPSNHIIGSTEGSPSPENSKNISVEQPELLNYDYTNEDSLHCPQVIGVPSINSFPTRESDYIPMSSSHQCSPFILDTFDQSPGGEMITLPFESPSITNYSCSQEYRNNEPFSPPPQQVLQDYHRPLRRLPNYPLYLHSQASSPKEPISLRAIYRKRFRHKFDPIVSPVIPQPGMKRSRHHNGHNQVTQKKEEPLKSSWTGQSAPCGKNSTITFKPKNELFQYGNYNRYYGYRNGGDGDDPRLRALKKEWFEGKDVLDIGCNIGHVTLTLARDFKPQLIRGVDIDNKLITIARKNIIRYGGHKSDFLFPNSFSKLYGSLHPPPTTGILALSKTERVVPCFPYNVSFEQENYVLDSDDLLEGVKEEYDVILCLSLTKWVHLNFGDDGLKRFFHRSFRNLRRNGLFILEPQPWSSYKGKKNLTERIAKNSKNMVFLPDHFQDYLLKVVGYTHVDSIGIPNHHLKGFRRPLLVFRKGVSPKCS